MSKDAQILTHCTAASRRVGWLEQDKHHWKIQCTKFERAFILARKENVVLRTALAAMAKDPDVRVRFDSELAALHAELDKLKIAAAARKKSYSMG